MNTNNEMIQWPRAQYWDKPWNPYIGCIPISPGCENCYACRMWKRFGKSFEPHLSCKQRPPRHGVIFCGNMTDMFADFAVDNVFSYWRRCYKLCHRDEEVFLWLTKRPRNMIRFFSAVKDLMREIEEDWMNCPFVKEFGVHDDRPFDKRLHESLIDFTREHYFGFTAENQEWYDRRFYYWRADKPTWAKGWLSAEPLLGPIDLGLGYMAPEDLPFKWIVVGCESGPNRRPCKIEWVESIVAQAMARDIPVFVKQLDIDGQCVTDITKFPKHLQIRQVPWAEITAED